MNAACVRKLARERDVAIELEIRDVSGSVKPINVFE
jgi:hypothetical protein